MAFYQNQDSENISLKFIEIEHLEPEQCERKASNPSTILCQIEISQILGHSPFHMNQRQQVMAGIEGPENQLTNQFLLPIQKPTTQQSSLFAQHQGNQSMNQRRHQNLYTKDQKNKFSQTFLSKLPSNPEVVRFLEANLKKAPKIISKQEDLKLKKEGIQGSFNNAPQRKFRNFQVPCLNALKKCCEHSGYHVSLYNYLKNKKTLTRGEFNELFSHPIYKQSIAKFFQSKVIYRQFLNLSLQSKNRQMFLQKFRILRSKFINGGDVRFT